MKKIKYLIWHCTATPNSRYIDKNDVFQWHLKENGWKAPGYRILILRDGSGQILRDFNFDNYIDPWEVTNGARGFNSVAWHIAIAGGGTHGNYENPLTPEIEKRVRYWSKSLVALYPDIQIGGHCDFDKSKPFCPGFDVAAKMREYGIPEKNIYA